MKPFAFKSYSNGDIKIRYSESISDDEYMKTAYSFLNKLMKEVARLTMKCFRPDIEADNLPYMHTEIRWDSVVLPALSKICDGLVLTELPVDRKESKTDENVRRGRIDYWCVYGGYSFVIEMKGSRALFMGNRVIARESSVIERWNTMIGQLNDIKEICHDMDEHTRGVIRLGLHFISSVAYVKPTEEIIRDYRRGIYNRLNDISTDIAKRHGNKADYTPSYAAAWLIPDDMITYWENWEEVYPGVMLFAKVFKDIKHKNHI